MVHTESGRMAVWSSDGFVVGLGGGRGRLIFAAPKDPLSVLGANLRYLRARRELTQEQFALNAEVGMSYYSRLERGEVNPGLRTLIRIARAFGVSPAELLDGVMGVSARSPHWGLRGDR